MTPVQFFFRHAGYSYDPATETRTLGRWRALAAAEARGQAIGLTFAWEYDDEPWDGDAPAPDELLGCICRDARGDVLASLWGIGDPDQNYIRVVEAELAMEALAAIDASIAQAI